MTAAEATAEVFLKAFNALSRNEKEYFLSSIIKNRKLRHDLMDLAVIEERRSDKERPFREYLKERNSKHSKE